MAATSLLKSDSCLGARYRHLRRQLPSNKAAVKAMARKELDLATLESKARAKGFQLIPIAQAS